MPKKTGIGAAVAALIFAASALAQPAPRVSTTEFITKAAQSDSFERREGQLAEKRGSSRQVKAFGADMVIAHTRTTMALESAIRRAHITPQPKAELTADQMSRLDALMAMHGGTFDRAYMDQQVDAHQDTLNVMTDYAQNGPSGPIRAAARKTAPLVQHHLDMAKAIRSRLGPGL